MFLLKSFKGAQSNDVVRSDGSDHILRYDEVLALQNIFSVNTKSPSRETLTSKTTSTASAPSIKTSIPDTSTGLTESNLNSSSFFLPSNNSSYHAITSNYSSINESVWHETE